MERRKRGETARWRARSRTGRAARIQPPFAAGEDGEASPRLCTRAKDGQEGFVGIGGTDGPGGQRERLLVGKGKGERVESSQAGRRKQPGIELIVFGCSRVWLLFRCDSIRCFLGRVGRFVRGVGGGGCRGGERLSPLHAVLLSGANNLKTSQPQVRVISSRVPKKLTA